MSEIRYFIMDVDGTLTDGKIYMGNDGEVCKAFDIKDGLGIHEILIPAGIEPIIITGRSSKILENRCKELGISKLFQGVKNKKEILNEILEKTKSAYNNTAYIGDDINDLSCMELIKEAGGLIGCPSDAVKQVKTLADFISTKPGGNGAVREFIEWVVERKFVHSL